MTAEASAVDLIRDGLRDFLRGHLGDPGLEVVAVDPIPEGHSGFTYFVDTAERGGPNRYVLRVPPPGAAVRGPADIPRQGRIMAALHDQGLPTPRIVANVAEPVLDGRPFCLMEAVDGVRIERAVGLAAPIEIARAAVATLRALQAVAPERSGIGGEPVVGLTEEMLRWNWLMQRAPEELTGQAPHLGALLAAGKPPDPAPVLVHGDFHYGNMLFQVEAGRPRVVALLDWEIAQLGAPLLDLGCLCVVAQRSAADPDAPNPGGGMDLDVAEVVGLYGADPVEARWYLALSCYKYAAIFGYNLMLHRRGKRPDPMYEKLTGVIQSLISSGATMLETA
ncbi:MAG TPA: phosphotransferase family protein [Candidatus Dormibacteraeota bacterium]|jgi:aminoglycoside phosphotransferase (APT) family kinase protein|nr:phosphotransferase family protein [Candidatus Dormibacteraeota bacterium]